MPDAYKSCLMNKETQAVQQIYIAVKGKRKYNHEPFIKKKRPRKQRCERKSCFSLHYIRVLYYLAVNHTCTPCYIIHKLIHN